MLVLEPQVAASPFDVPMENPFRLDTPQVSLRLPVVAPIESPGCECLNLFGRMMMWATRNVPRA